MSQAHEVRRRLQAQSAEHQRVCTEHNFYWYAAPADERGWVCCSCGWSPGEEPGYSPEHDRALIETKVGSILHDMHDAGIIYVSNGSAGEGIAESVAAHCRETGIYDSVSIARFILAGGDRHTAFWKERGESIIEGRDNRDRCKGGKLSHCSTSNGQGGWTYTCFDRTCACAEDARWARSES